MEFHPTPYAHLPASIHSSDSLPSDSTLSPGVSGSAARKANSAGTTASHIKDEIDKISVITKEAKVHSESADALRTHHTIAKMNFALRDEELTYQHEQLALEQTNAEVEFRYQHDLGQQQIELKMREEKVAALELEKLKLQLHLEEIQSKKQGR
jgi:UDP-N-acetylenolpyruvoylglucosamine reductase